MKLFPLNFNTLRNKYRNLLAYNHHEEGITCIMYPEYHLPKSRAIALNISMDSISISSPSLL